MKKIRATNLTTGLWYRDYNSIREAAEDLQLRPDGISRAVTLEYSHCGNYTFTHIKEVRDSSKTNTPIT